MNIRHVLQLPNLLEVKSIICVQPHPDDNEVGAAGTLRILKDHHCDITFVTVTDGRHGTSAVFQNPEELVSIRRKERIRAGELLGVTRHIECNFADGGNYTEQDLIAPLVHIFREIKPDMVMTIDPWMPYEAHPDHVKVGHATATAAMFAGNLTMFQEVGHPHSIPQIAFYGTSYPNTMIDITPYFETKMQAIYTHESQFANEDWPLISQFFRMQAAEQYDKGIQSMETLPHAQTVQDGLVDRYGEVFKVLALRELHFFPNAINS